MSQKKKKQAFTLVELLVVMAIIAVLASLLLPALASAKQRAHRVACISNLRQVHMGLALYLADHAERFPDRRDLKLSLGYRPWSDWPPSDPRAGWAAVVLSNEIRSEAIWSCPALKPSALSKRPQSAQSWRTSATDAVNFWMWRFDRPDDPVPLDGFWGKTAAQCVIDLAQANNPTTGTPGGPADVELAVDVYFPRTIPSIPAAWRGKAAHLKGKNRLFLDGHAVFEKDQRLD